MLKSTGNIELSIARAVKESDSADLCGRRGLIVLLAGRKALSIHRIQRGDKNDTSIALVTKTWTAFEDTSLE
jgi:hypothetical protein